MVSLPLRRTEKTGFYCLPIPTGALAYVGVCGGAAKEPVASERGRVGESDPTKIYLQKSLTLIGVTGEGRSIAYTNITKNIVVKRL